MKICEIFKCYLGDINERYLISLYPCICLTRLSTVLDKMNTGDPIQSGYVQLVLAAGSLADQKSTDISKLSFNAKIKNMSLRDQFLFQELLEKEIRRDLPHAINLWRNEVNSIKQRFSDLQLQLWDEVNKKMVDVTDESISTKNGYKIAIYRQDYVMSLAVRDAIVILERLAEFYGFKEDLVYLNKQDELFMKITEDYNGEDLKKSRNISIEDCGFWRRRKPKDSVIID